MASVNSIDIQINRMLVRFIFYKPPFTQPNSFNWGHPTPSNACFLMFVAAFAAVASDQFQSLSQSEWLKKIFCKRDNLLLLPCKAFYLSSKLHIEIIIFCPPPVTNKLFEKELFLFPSLSLSLEVLSSVTRLGEFSKFLVTNLLLKVAEIFDDCLGQFKTYSFLIKNCYGHLLGNFQKKWTFFIVTSGRTVPFSHYHLILVFLLSILIFPLFNFLSLSSYSSFSSFHSYFPFILLSLSLLRSSFLASCLWPPASAPAK